MAPVTWRSGSGSASCSSSFSSWPSSSSSRSAAGPSSTWSDTSSSPNCSPSGAGWRTTTHSDSWRQTAQHGNSLIYCLFSIVKLIMVYWNIYSPDRCSIYFWKRRHYLSGWVCCLFRHPSFPPSLQAQMRGDNLNHKSDVSMSLCSLLNCINFRLWIRHYWNEAIGTTKRIGKVLTGIQNEILIYHCVWWLGGVEL